MWLPCWVHGCYKPYERLLRMMTAARPAEGSSHFSQHTYTGMLPYLQCCPDACHSQTAQAEQTQSAGPLTTQTPAPLVCLCLAACHGRVVAGQSCMHWKEPNWLHALTCYWNPHQIMTPVQALGGSCRCTCCHMLLAGPGQQQIVLSLFNTGKLPVRHSLRATSSHGMITSNESVRVTFLLGGLWQQLCCLEEDLLADFL